MKTLLLEDNDYSLLADLQTRLRTQDTACTELPAYVVYHGVDFEDPEKRITGIFLTEEDAEIHMAVTKHHGPHFVYVHSFNRGRATRWLLLWIRDVLPTLAKEDSAPSA